MRKISFATITLLVALLMGFSNSEAAPKLSRASIIGCWDRIHNKPFGRWPPTQNALCFDRHRKLHGITIDDGDGWDYGGIWKYADRDSISIHFPHHDEPRRGTCSFWTDQAREVLIFTECKNLKWDGAWRRDLEAERPVKP